MEKLLKVSDVAESLGVKAATVRDWLRTGQLEGHQINGRWRIKESELSSHWGEGSPLTAEDVHSGVLTDRWPWLVQEIQVLGTGANLREVIEALDRVGDVFPGDPDEKDGDWPSYAVSFMADELKRLLSDIAGWDVHGKPQPNAARSLADL